MYAYNEIDQHIVDARVEEFRDQVRRHQEGSLSDDEFLALRLRNGLYKQRHAYMLRVAIPYGLLSSEQLRTLGHIARTYDRGFGHFTTRQNIQYHWPELEDVPDILADLAKVQMHAIQTSGNCVRNTTVDHLAGVAADEAVDPRPYAEMIRQWSTLHPEFNYLPRKFKIALTGAKTDRAAVRLHDIGLIAKKDDAGAVGFEVIAGGGIGRTPVVGPTIHDFVPAADLLSYIEAILRVYNLEGDRKNKFKARIKILVRKLGAEVFAQRVAEEHARIKDGPLKVGPEHIEHFVRFFAPPAYIDGLPDEVETGGDPAFARFVSTNVLPHKAAGYRAVSISVKAKGRVPGDVTADEMDALAALADRFSFGELRTTHEQNLVFAHVEAREVRAIYDELAALGLASANGGLLTDLICCPGLDYCNLANAHSIPVAGDITARLDGTDKLHQIGEVKLKMSGCVNACGHHHAGHIGILGIDKKGEEAYQIMLGGSADHDASLGRWLGPALPRERVAEAVDRLADVYLESREGDERFIDTVRRLGLKPFHDGVYGESVAAATGGEER